MTTTDVPLLDRAIAKARDRALTMQSVLWTLAASTIYVPSGADPGPDRAGMRPVYYQNGETRMLAAFTSPDAASTLGELAPFVVAFSGEDLLRTIPVSEGLVVNPGAALGFDIAPEGLAAFRQEIAS
ncbi:SseB family protein [Microbacterium sp. P02]|uniref:SseB family protein n=1 Tax=unclassified Microbacterium TaxID=2609290 RepID=UPI003672DC8D